MIGSFTVCGFYLIVCFMHIAELMMPS